MECQAKPLINLPTITTTNKVRHNIGTTVISAAKLEVKNLISLLIDCCLFVLRICMCN